MKGHGDHGGAEADGQRDDEAVSKDDEDDDEDVQKARAWDDWKDGKALLCHHRHHYIIEETTMGVG